MNTAIRTVNINVDGLTFEVATCGSGSKFALLLHGFPEHACSWRFQLKFLARLGYTVWAPNMRGYGNSSRPMSVSDYALHHLLTDITRLIDCAGFREAMLVGHDWGGTLGWYYAANAPQRISRLVVYNAPHPLVAQWSALNDRQRWRWFYLGLILSPQHARHALADGGQYSCFRRRNIQTTRQVLRTYLDNLRSPGAIDAMTNWYRAYLHPLTFVQPQHVATTLPLQVPVLNFAGGKDLVLDLSLLDGLERFVPDLDTRVFPELHHWINQEAPDESNQILREWLHVA